MDQGMNLETLDRLLVVQGYALTFSCQPNNSKSEQADVQITIWDLDVSDKALFAFRPPIS